MSKIEELREELRRGRIETASQPSKIADGTGSDFEGFSGSDHRAEQSVSFDLHRSDTEDDAIDGPHNDPQRSLDEIIVGGRSTNRRSSKSSSSPSGDSERVTGPKRRRGKLEADDAIPFRTKERKPKASTTKQVSEQPTEKETKSIQRGKETSKNRDATDEGEGEKQGFKFPKFKEGTTLTLAEAKALEGPLNSALAADFYYVDQYIWYRTRDTSQAPIWSDMDNEDITVLCSVLLKRGQKSPATATAVRMLVSGSTYMEVAMLMGPRFMRTVEVLKAAPKIERPSLLQRKRLARGLE